MSWGYLDEFWNAVSSTTLNAWEYTADWFQNVGNAVAGAIGNLFEFVNHYISDIFVFLGWLSHNLGFIFAQIFAPIRYIFQFFSSFIEYAFITPEEPTEIWSFSTSTVQVFESIPYWTEFATVLGVGILVLGGVAIIKLFLHI